MAESAAGNQTQTLCVSDGRLADDLPAMAGLSTVASSAIAARQIDRSICPVFGAYRSKHHSTSARWVRSRHIGTSLGIVVDPEDFFPGLCGLRHIHAEFG